MTRLIVCCAASLLWATSARTSAQDESLESAAIRRLASAFETLLAEPDPDFAGFLDNYSPGARERLTDDRLAMILGMYCRDVPGARALAARRTGDARGQVTLVSERSGMSVILDLDLELTSPYRIAGMSARLVEGNPVIQGIVDGMSPEEIGEVLSDLLQRLAYDDEFSGVALLVKDGEVLHRQAYGLASRRFDVPNRVDTKFNLGSMNKMFTATAILQLAQAGRLDVHGRLIEYLPDFPNREVAERVTLHHLLTHTSGMGSFWEAMEGMNWTTLREPADHLPLFAHEPLEFEPGARMSYSNSGFLVLGLVIEAVTGQTYYDYVREHVFEPAGMTDTDSWAMDEVVPNLAIGYTRAGEGGHGHDGPLRNNLFLHRLRGGPAGGGFSTVDDLARFGQALAAGTLLDAEHTELLLTGKVDTGWGPGMRYAYGFMDQILDGHRLLGHNGGAPGISSEFAMVPGDGYLFAILSNLDGGATFVGGRLREMISRTDAES